MLIELPVLVAVATEPVPADVVPLVGETHGDAVVAERPYLLDQPVVELLIPLAPKERLDGLAALEELRAITPAAADGPQRQIVTNAGSDYRGPRLTKRNQEGL